MNSTLLAFFPLALMILFAWAISRAIKRYAKKYPPAVSDQGNIAGVGGWLLLLILGLMFLGPFMGAGRINTNFMSIESQYPDLKSVVTWCTFKSATWWTFFVFCCLSFYAGFGLLKGRYISVVKRAKVLF